MLWFFLLRWAFRPDPNQREIRAALRERKRQLRSE